jgi:hypothetical protein
VAQVGAAHHRKTRGQMKRLYQVPDDFEAGREAAARCASLRRPWLMLAE